MLQGQAEQLTQKAMELALGGDITALRLCLERLIPPRKDRPINLSLPPIENVQQISLAMTRVSTAIGEGEITPMEGEVLANVLAAHKAVLVTGELERRVDDLEQRMSQATRASATSPSTSGVQASTPGATSGTKSKLGKSTDSFRAAPGSYACADLAPGHRAGMGHRFHHGGVDLMGGPVAGV